MNLRMLNPRAQSATKTSALAYNINAAKGLQEVLRTNLGPRGTIKMLVGGAGDIKITKDGNVLLHEMQLQNPTASMIARSATSQDEITGDGTTTIVLLIADILKNSERYLNDGVHPRVLVEGIDLARTKVLEFLEVFKVKKDVAADRELLLNVARSSIRTKVNRDVADKLSDIVVDAVLTIRRDAAPVDLFMVETMTMTHKTPLDSRLVKGLVLDHGGRHPGMKKELRNAFILTCNVNLEWEKSEINAVTVYSDPKQRDKLVDAERRTVDEKVRKIIDLKRRVCGDAGDKGFVVVNQKGIDPPALDMLAKEGILALRRAKRRNMERLTLAAGGVALNDLDDASLVPASLGFAEQVYEQSLGEDVYTFIEGVRSPQSVTVLLKGPNAHTIAQLKDAVRDGLRAVKNAIEDQALVPGGGAFECAASLLLQQYGRSSAVQGRAKWGVQVLADALLCVPKTLADNSGFDAQDVVLALQEQHQGGHVVGLDVSSGEPMDPAAEGVWDVYRVKRQILTSATVVAEQLLLVDEILKAAKGKGGDSQGPQEE